MTRLASEERKKEEEGREIEKKGVHGVVLTEWAARNEQVLGGESGQFWGSREKEHRSGSSGLRVWRLCVWAVSQPFRTAFARADPSASRPPGHFLSAARFHESRLHKHLVQGPLYGTSAGSHGAMRYSFYVGLTSVLFFVNVLWIYNSAQYGGHNGTSSNVPEASLVNENKLCNVTDSLALSALQRAKTTLCRSKITDSSCQLASGTFHDQFPLSTCSNYDDLLEDIRVGCFSDQKGNRTLDDFSYEFATSNSKKKCRQSCYKAGFLYYGLEFGKECFCGNSIGHASVLDDSECQKYPCSDGSSSCGGFNAVEIFRTGIKEILSPLKVLYVNETFDAPQVKILFVLQLNGRNDRQVKRFLKSIYSPHHYYYVHVDKRQSYMFEEVEKIASKLGNMFISKTRYSTIWGGASLLEMFQDVIAQALENRETADWDYVINFSESDFPTLPIKDFELLLRRNMGYSFLASHGYNTGRFIQKQGFEYVFMECEERMWRIGNRGNFPANLQIDGGSDWVVLHRDLAEFSVSNEELPRKLRNLFKSIILPLESFYHTLSLNSQYCDKVVASNLRLTNWYRKQGCRCAGLKKVVDWCGCSPLVFREETIPKFSTEKSKAKPFFFARKFDSIVNVDAIAAVEKLSVDRDSIDFDHPSYNSSFVNVYKRDIDGNDTNLESFSFSIAEISPINLHKPVLERIDAFRRNSTASVQLVVTLKADFKIVQFLLSRKRHVELMEPLPIDDFFLKDVEYGTKYDLKEEICRSFLGLVTNRTLAQVRLVWDPTHRRILASKNGKTSPTVEMLWRDANGRTVAISDMKPYDSAFGGQFAELNIDSVNTSALGEWSVVVRGRSEKSPIAVMKFPVFPEGRISDLELIRKFYELNDHCESSDCKKLPWSTMYPDPKSDIVTGGVVPSGAVIQDLTTLVNSIDSQILEVSLPDVEDFLSAYAPAMYANVFLTKNVHGSIFGIRRAGEVIPLHNHPNMHGFLRILRGKVKAKYEGEVVIDEKDSCVFLDPVIGNVHEVTALNDATFFFDLLIPGYRDRNCTYFRKPRENFLPGSFYTLKKISAPPSFFCAPLRYDPKQGWTLNEKLVEEIFDSQVPKEASILEKALCDEDLRDFGDPALARLYRKEDGYCQGPLILQLVRYRNVCLPKVREVFGSEQSGSIIRLSLTDGHASFAAILMESVIGISSETPPGTKLVLNGRISVEGQFMLLDKSNTRVLGGKVEKLIEKWVIEKNAFAAGGDKKSASGAPKWISFGKKGASAISSKQTGNFRANDAMQPKDAIEPKEENEEFAKNREQTLRELQDNDEKQKKFAKPSVPLPTTSAAENSRKSAEERKSQPKKEKVNERKGRGRRGDPDSEDFGETKPSVKPTLFDFVSSSMPIETKEIPSRSGNFSNVSSDRFDGPKGHSDGNQRNQNQRLRTQGPREERREPRNQHQDRTEKNPRTETPNSNRNNGSFSGRNDGVTNANRQNRNNGRGQENRRTFSPKRFNENGNRPQHHQKDYQGPSESKRPPEAANFGKGSFNARNDAKRDFPNETRRKQNYERDQDDRKTNYNGNSARNDGGTNENRQKKSFGRGQDVRTTTEEGPPRRLNENAGSGNRPQNQSREFQSVSSDSRRDQVNRQDQNFRNDNGSGHRGQQNFQDSRPPPRNFKEKESNNRSDYQSNRNDFEGHNNRREEQNIRSRPNLDGHRPSTTGLEQRFQRMNVNNPSFPPPPSGHFGVGAQCMAPWQDGEFYRATIVQLGPAGMCTVRYDDYGTHESLPLAVLLR
ncbi:unnamed protein product [Caenorhabditis auriculariae]|uniref:protein xylosyltransferase n=1 Tax=Caenorhabditis auriculariae TaxID=2777116 RepID=A0A8S1H0D4_9PELO|nr:unnamed protein product [Caenorhabditis auriculariae]